MNPQANINLQALNTLGIPSLAEYFVECISVEELREALNWARACDLAFRVLAGGSNVVLADKLPGLTICPGLKGIHLLEEDEDNVVLKIGAGENWHSLVTRCTEAGWYGLENLAYIPGSAGAAPIQNIGAYGVEVKDRIVSVDVLNTENLQEERFSNADCQFAYRESIFKQQLASRYIVTAIELKLSKIAQVHIDYPALKNYLFGRNLATTPGNVLKAVVSIRKSKLPDPIEVPNAGSFFKNPLVQKEKYLSLKEKYAALVGFEQDDATVKLAAAWLIESLGWKGKSLDGVSVHKEHALVIVNPARKSAAQVIALANKIKEDVLRVYGIELEQEPQFIT